VKLIAGLGNPGSKYKLTRHNIGFIILDYLAEFLSIDFKAGKGDWYGASGKIGNNDFYLMKPVTYMNDSGIAVSDFVNKSGIKPEDILVVQDDFQLQLGTIRVRPNGSDGGHNGIYSIIYHLNTMDFPRMRAGIGRKTDLKKEEYIDFVLSEFSDDEKEIIKTLLPFYKNCIFTFIEKGIKETMNSFNRNFLENTDEKGTEQKAEENQVQKDKNE